MWIESKNLHLQITQVSLSESAICPSYLDFEIRSFIRYFVRKAQRIVWAKCLIKLRITNSKKKVEIRKDLK